MLTFAKRTFLICFLALPALLIADCVENCDSFHDCTAQRDYEAVQEFVNSKRTIPLAEKWGKLKVKGNIRTDILDVDVRLGKYSVFEGAVLRNSTNLLSNVSYEAELNVFVEYESESGKTWGKSRVQLDNQWGIGDTFRTCPEDPQGMFGSGEFGSLDLKWAYWGWEIASFCNDAVKVNLEIGRRKLYMIFDSRIEFSSTADGLSIEIKRKFKPDWLVYGKGALFVVDDRVDYYAGAFEIGSLDFFESKFDWSYSLIDWDTTGRNRCGTRDPLGTDFVISQWALAYNFPKELFGKKARLYGAVLYNHAGKDIIQFDVNHGKQNAGWYLGYIIGDVKKPGDWSIDWNYQYVEAMSIPSKDVFGIARGVEFRRAPSIDGYGKANYKGWQMEALYQLSEKISIDAMWAMSWTIDKSIGLINPVNVLPSADGIGDLRYKKFEIDFILKF